MNNLINHFKQQHKLLALKKILKYKKTNNIVNLSVIRIKYYLFFIFFLIKVA